MKSVGVQYLEAIRNLKAKGFVPLRTVHVLFVPGIVLSFCDKGFY